MAQFFDKFPVVKYNMSQDGNLTKEFDFPVNILTRIGFIANSLDNIFIYYDYVIKDTDKPEILAERYYGDPESYWIIMLSNKRLDPLYDWPLIDRNFDKYIINKYGSIEDSKTAVHKYEKIIKTVDVSTNTETIRRYDITLSEYNALPNEDLNPLQLTIGNKTALMYTYRNIVYAYDYEFDLNEKKRNIKLIKSDYYQTIKSEFDDIMRVARKETVIESLARRL